MKEPPPENGKSKRPSKPAAAAFESELVTLPLDAILPTRQLAPSAKATAAYKAILASIREVGVIEPLVVHRQGSNYVLKDGHARLAALRELGHKEATCLVAKDGEAFTYNHKVNHIPPVQAHRMIERAVKAGVPEERIARALNMDVQTLRQRHQGLSGLCPEAMEILKDKQVAWAAFRHFRKVTPLRQVEMAELMVAAANYSTSYAGALVIATPPEQKREKDPPKGLGPDELARMENEMRTVEREVRLLNDTYGQNHLDLTVARGYLKKLLDNGTVVRFLAKKQPEFLSEFQHIIEATSLDS